MEGYEACAVIKDSPVVTFALAADAAAARRLRRMTAETGAQTGWLAGTWRELVDLAHRAYLLPVPQQDWQDVFEGALRNVPGAFWCESLDIAPDETRASVLSALCEIISSTEPDSPAAWGDLGQLPSRAAQHLRDLSQLVEALDGQLPPDLAAIQSIMRATPRDALHLIRVDHIEGHPHLSRWQQALVAKLNRDVLSQQRDPAGKPLDPSSHHEQVALGCEAGDPSTALGHLQRVLFKGSARQAVLDDSVQWLAVRDFLQEAEVAAGMAQELLRSDPGLRPADIGILLPDSFEYSVAVHDAFGLAGLLTSGLAVDWWRRDLGLEWLFHFLYCRQKPAPAMALAICLASPLMPWPREVGAAMAQQIMGGEYGLDFERVQGRIAQRMMILLQEGDRSPETLQAAIREIPELLGDDEALSGHREHLQGGLRNLDGLLESAQELDWRMLRRAVRPRVIRSEAPSDFNLEGVTVWTEGQEPWRQVKHLLVLGFARGAYPARRSAGAVFSEPDLEALREQLGLPVDTPARQTARRRVLFRRQLGAVSSSVSFLSPRRDASGSSQGPSESLVFMTRLFDGVTESEGLVCELDTAQGRAQAHSVAFASPASPKPPREMLASDLALERDLIAVRKDAQGNPRPESPSSLETLLVSPLAWLLRRVGAEPSEWAPEAPGPILLGSIAHKVLEELFPQGQPIPGADDIETAIPERVDNTLRNMAPFMLGDQWQMELRRFSRGLALAASKWREILVQINAEVLLNESWLWGQWSGIPVHGQTDQILGLPDDRLLVVDYKRSRSSSRQPRMEKGYDCQANLYRLMLETGGLKDSDDGALNQRLKRARRIDVVYFLLNDQVALTDYDLAAAGGIPNWRALGPDVSGHAMDALRERLKDVQRGIVKMNRVDDRDRLKKEAGIEAYALENSPLISLFSIADEAEGAQ
jgi:RecB family exonuclease